MIWLLTNALALGAFWYLPRWWVKQDVAAIQADGSKDSLHEDFHRNRAILRASTLLLVSGLGAAPWIHAGWGPWALNGVGLFSLGAAWFFFDFNPRLSKARGLPTYYVSSDSRAAWMPDRYIWQKTVKACPPPKAVEPSIDWVLCRKQCAANLLKRLLRQVLAAGLLVYLAAAVAANVVGV